MAEVKKVFDFVAFLGLQSNWFTAATQMNNVERRPKFDAALKMIHSSPLVMVRLCGTLVEGQDFPESRHATVKISQAQFPVANWTGVPNHALWVSTLAECYKLQTKNTSSRLTTKRHGLNTYEKLTTSPIHWCVELITKLWWGKSLPIETSKTTFFCLDL